MSVGMSDQNERGMSSAILATGGTSGGNDVEEQSLDATEDRLIWGYQVHVEDVDQVQDLNINIEMWTGSDPFAGDSYVNQDEQFAASFDAVLNTNSSAGLALATPIVDDQHFHTPFEWDEHVTLTLRASNESGQNVNAELVVYYENVAECPPDPC